MESVGICGVRGISPPRDRGPNTLKVKDASTPRRVSAPHGLSHHERHLLTEGLAHMRRRGPCVFVSIEAGQSPGSENTVRALTRRIKSWIALRQRRVCAVKDGAFQWVQAPPGETLQPEATGAVMEVTKWLKPPG